MSQYDNTNKGQIWGNDKKKTANQPDFKGSINVEGVEYWLSAWKRDPNGNPKAPALRFSIKRKDEVHEQGYQQAQQQFQQTPAGFQQAPQQQQAPAPDFEDDPDSIPF